MSDLNPQLIAEQLEDAVERTWTLIEGLTTEQLMGPLLPTVNPLLWEIGHAAYFYEYWVLRQHLKHALLRKDVDSLYDSIGIAHDDRWDLPLPSLRETQTYIADVMDNIISSLANGEDNYRDYLAQYAVFHHDMHNEAFTYTRQTLNYPAPTTVKPGYRILDAGSLDGDADIPGGEFMLGATREQGFVFDNEKWAHPLEVEAFSIARAAVSNADYLAFVDADRYSRRVYWSDESWRWLQQTRLKHPVYWRHDASGWQIRQFDQWQAMPKNAALIHVSWYEAQAYCRWAGRRLPSEVEWEVAAAAEPANDGQSLSSVKRLFPWGDEFPDHERANLDGYSLGTNDVGAHARGDSAFGCRQMIGNVWEWTADTFTPYPGFVADMYEDYSQPLFGTTRVLRGGAWTTRSRMIRNTWRSYYGPDRNDVFSGFRTCAVK